MRVWTRRITMFDKDDQVVGIIELSIRRGEIFTSSAAVPNVTHWITEPAENPRHISPTKPREEPPMPCQSDYMAPTPQEKVHAAVIERATAGYKAELDRITSENDRLREMVIRMAGGQFLTADEIRLVEGDQIEHRKADLARLEQVFIKAKDTDLLALVWKADPTQPLGPQLGFSPDAY